ncbi:ABC transporter permease [Xanthomonas albilineans]|uniref:Transport permease protein n=1 Tax=Xanthomonas albilineans (strain GPE PC73 / CFBP 7063) TaxID=380358 RepID=D2UFM6_XANAP|nr:ABC transporter permease [Xanthomonas albilineans]QHQ29436.1 putative ABC transporter permease protein [Xanthomonas albilineans]CBA17187.1 probable abc transporter permease protein [Xanthomonas albilineans GPE PC73]
MSSLIAAAWRYRGFIVSSIANDFRSKLARSKLGTLWIVLQPLAQALIFAVVLSNVLAAKLPGVENHFAFAVYLLSGLLCWSAFAEIVQRCLTVFIDNGSLLKKMQFPRISLPLVAVGSAMVTNVALLAVIMVLVPILGISLTPALVWLPLLLSINVALATGIGLLLGTLNVFARDIGQIMAVAMQFWFWMTPIAYPAQVVPERFQAILRLNPVAALATGYHDIFLYGRAPQNSLVYPAVFALVALALSFFVFRRASAEMVDAL